MVQVAAGDGHSTCVAADSSVYIRGNNDSDQLGQTDMGDANLPVLDGNANVKSE